MNDRWITALGRSDIVEANENHVPSSRDTGLRLKLSCLVAFWSWIRYGLRDYQGSHKIIESELGALMAPDCVRTRTDRFQRSRKPPTGESCCQDIRCKTANKESFF